MAGSLGELPSTALPAGPLGSHRAAAPQCHLPGGFWLAEGAQASRTVSSAGRGGGKTCPSVCAAAPSSTFRMQKKGTSGPPFPFFPPWTLPSTTLFLKPPPSTLSCSRAEAKPYSSLLPAPSTTGSPWQGGHYMKPHYGTLVQLSACALSHSPTGKGTTKLPPTERKPHVQNPPATPNSGATERCTHFRDMENSGLKGLGPGGAWLPGSASHTPLQLSCHGGTRTTFNIAVPPQASTLNTDCHGYLCFPSRRI